jgi:cytochrome c-type biogenesis protein CcmH
MNVVPIFWAIAVALLAITVAVIVWPLLRRTNAAAPSEDAARTAVYRDAKRQLDDDRAAGVLDDAGHAAGVAELAQRLGVELDAPAEAAPTTMSRARIIAALVAVAVVPLGAIGLYAAVGAPEALRPMAAAPREAPNDQQIVAMVESLAAKMKANPGDPKGWRLLARSYAALGRYAESAQAYGEAARRGGEDADVLADWAESLALAQNQVISGEPETLARRALALDDRHPKALALVATAAVERGDFDGSLALWRRLYAQFAPTSEDATRTLAAINEVERMRDKAAASGAPRASGNVAGAARPPAPADARRAPSTASAAPPAAAGAQASNTAITGRVEIAAAMAGRVAAGDTVYVYARVADGPRRPLAVQRTAAGTWPLAFRLDDTMTMAGGPPLSSAASVVVEARVSHTGEATPRSGDLTGRSAPVAPGTHDLRIVIDQVVP